MNQTCRHPLALRTAAWAAVLAHGATSAWAQSCKQPAEHCQLGDRWNALASNGTDHVAADNFVPRADGSVTQVCWWGAYLGGTADCDPGQNDSFEITYYDDAGGVPGSVIAGPFRQTGGTLTVAGPTLTGDVLLDGIPEYAFQAAHSAVNITAGECYWIEIRNTRNDGCSWYWETAEPQDRLAIHDGAFAFSPMGYDSLDFVPQDLAFCLDGSIGAPALCTIAPTNDDCEDAQLVSEGVYAFNTIGAWGDGFEYPLCGYYECCDFLVDDPALHRDVWFRFSPQCDGLLKLDVCDSNYDSKIAVHSAGFGETCPHLGYSRALACNDDGCGTEPHVPTDTCEGLFGPLPCFDGRCIGRVRAVAPERCDRWREWDGYCIGLAQALCREPGGETSDLVLTVLSGQTYFIRVGGYESDIGRDYSPASTCPIVCDYFNPSCCEMAWDAGCEEDARHFCSGDAGSGVLRVDLIALPPVQTNLRHLHDFLGCFTGPCADPPCEPPIYPEPCCLNQDFDNDGDVDTDDYAHHLAPSLTGP